MDHKNTIIPNGTTKIEAHAYENKQDIESVAFPTSLKYIGENAFYNCSSLKVMELPSGIEWIEHRAFKGCPAVIFVPKSIRHIGAEAFAKNAVVFFESGENDFDGYYNDQVVYDYPDSYYRGPSMGVDHIITRYYQTGCKRFYNATHAEFLAYIKEHS
ncbi:MAG: leucine-rich repeat domain-containing protein [Bacilli bacterium]|nr:leucine-rich repeat domain-containing protein [Bacilli bacterium]